MENLNMAFVDELLSCSLKNKSFFIVINGHLKSNFLPNEEYRDLWDEVLLFFDENNKLPTFGSLQMSFKDNRDVRKIVSRLKKIVEIDKDSLMIKFEEFIKKNMFLEYYDKVTNEFNSGDHKAAYSFFIKEADRFSKFSMIGETFEPVFGGYSVRQVQRLLDSNSETIEYIPLGIPALDKELDGGGRLGEAMILCAPSGKSKSFFLIHCGINAARRGHNVAHFQLEGTRKQIVDRYDAAWTGTLYKDVRRGIVSDNKTKALQKVRDKIKGEVFISTHDQFDGITVPQIRSKYIELVKKHGHIPVLIVDYFELATPGDRNYSPAEERFRQNKLGEQFKALAVEFNCLVITVTQASNISPELLENPDFILTRDNLSENKLKIKPFDVFLTINQTKDEKMEQVIRLAGDKFRDSEGIFVTTLCQNLARSRWLDNKRTKEQAAEIAEKIKERELVRRSEKGNRYD